MSTCLRNGVRFKRHAWNDDGICDLCGHQSEWFIQLKNEREARALLNQSPNESAIRFRKETETVETATELTDRVLHEIEMKTGDLI